MVKETWTFGRSLRHSQLLSEHWPFGPENTPSGVATSVLAQVVSASSAERNWSVYGQIKPKNRSRTGHDTSNKRVYAHEALHLREKLQKVSYKPKIEKWGRVIQTQMK